MFYIWATPTRRPLGFESWCRHCSAPPARAVKHASIFDRQGPESRWNRGWMLLAWSKGQTNSKNVFRHSWLLCAKMTRHSRESQLPTMMRLSVYKKHEWGVQPPSTTPTSSTPRHNHLRPTCLLRAHHGEPVHRAGKIENRIGKSSQNC